MDARAPRRPQRVVALALREDEAKAVHVLLAALELGEGPVRDEPTVGRSAIFGARHAL